MVTTEHRKPLVAFLVVFAAACLVMGNGLRTQVVEVLIETGGSNELVTAIAPDMVLGQALDGAPQPQAAAKKVPAVQGPVQAGADDAGRHEQPVHHTVLGQLVLGPVACRCGHAHCRLEEGYGSPCESTGRPSLGTRSQDR